MRIFTVYRNPSDHPGKIVVRAFTIDGSPEPKADPEPFIVAPDTPGGLAGARATIRAAGYYYRIGRHPNDESQIFEVWL